MKLRHKLWVEKVVAKLSNWILNKLGEPRIFSTQWDQEPRYWMELRQYVKMLPLRGLVALGLKDKIPPVPLKEVAHNEFHPYDGTGRLVDITPKRHIDACYLDPPPMDFPTVEQFSLELDHWFKVRDDAMAAADKETDGDN